MPMSNRPLNTLPNQSAELGNLLANTIAGVVSAQEKLDRYTEQRQQAYQNTEPGQFALPPIWYLFKNVSLEMELSANVATVALSDNPNEEGQPHLICRTLDPTMVSLYGYQAASGMRVRVEMEPQGFVPIKEHVVDN